MKEPIKVDFIVNAKPRTQNSEPRTQNSEPKTLNHEVVWHQLDTDVGGYASCEITIHGHFHVLTTPISQMPYLDHVIQLELKILNTTKELYRRLTES